MFSVVLVFSIIGLGRILISDLLVANLLMYSLPGMILLYLAAPFFTSKVFLGGIYIYIYTHTTILKDLPYFTEAYILGIDL